MGDFESITHDSYIACAVESKLDAPLLMLTKELSSWSLDRIVADCGAKLLGDFELGLIDIECIDSIGSTRFSRLDYS